MSTSNVLARSFFRLLGKFGKSPIQKQTNRRHTNSLSLEGLEGRSLMAANLSVAPITWNVIGLDSNKVTDGPNQFLVGVEIKNDGDTTASGVNANFNWNDSTFAYNDHIHLVAGSLPTVSVGNIAPGQTVNAYFNVEVDRTTAAFSKPDANPTDAIPNPTARRYQIEATSIDATSAQTLGTQELYVEHLISQNRNGVRSITGPSLVELGQTVQFTVSSFTATQGYEQLQDELLLPNQIFQIVSVNANYAVSDGSLTNTSVYSNASGWYNDPASPKYLSPINKDKAGGDPISTTYTVKVIGTGDAFLNDTVRDFSGSSFHYALGTGLNVSSVEHIVPEAVPNRIGSVAIAAQTGSATYGTATDLTYNITADRATSPVNGNPIAGTINGAYSVVAQSGLPNGVLVNFSPSTVTSTGTNAIPGSTLTLTTESTTPAGTYHFTVMLQNTSNTSDFQTAEGTLIVNKAASSVLVTGGSYTYDGTTHFGGIATVSGPGVVTGSAVLSYTGDQVNAGTYTVIGTYGGDANHFGSSGSATITIHQAIATVTADNKSKTYGDVNPTLTASVIGQVVGGDSINFSLGTTATQFSNVGNYPIVVTAGTNPNYIVTYVDGTLAIAKALATVAADDKSKAYGDVNPTLTASVIGQVVGGAVINFTLDTSATQFSNVGDYEITVTAGSNPNYEVSYTNGTLTITKALATVVVDNQTKAYGEINPTLTATIDGQVAGGAVINYSLDTLAGQFSNVGDYEITVTAGSNPNYEVSYTNGTLTITKALATVVVDNQTKAYGEINPTLTATIDGQVAGGDVINFTLDTSATQFSNVGDYEITVTVGSNPNYEVTYTNGTLTITKALATVVVDNKSKTYGDVNPALTALVTGQVVGGDAINYTLGTGATQFSNVGDYTITVTAGSNPNYEVSYTDGTLTIGKATATIVVNGYTGFYDANFHGATLVSATGVNGEVLTSSVTMGGQTFKYVPGGVATWSFENPNYFSQTGTADILIKASAVPAGKTLGYYSNKNGQKELTGSTTGANLETTLFNTLFAPNTGILAKNATESVLVDAKGNYIPLASFKSYAFVNSFLLNATATNMGNMLSAQMLTTQFNVLLGKVDATRSVNTSAVLAATQQSSLTSHGITSTNGGSASIQASLNAAIAQLKVAPNTTTASANRTYEEALKNIFDALNNNLNIYI